MVRNEIHNLVRKAIQKAQKEKKMPKFDIPKILVEHPGDEKFGDYATNIAMQIAKITKKNPMEMATIINNQLSTINNRFLEKIEIIKPGFINFFLSKEFLVNEINKLTKEKNKYGSTKVGKSKIVVIDYSSPNIAKPFGMGNLRSTIIGQAIYNIYKFSGWKCIGDNHLGDWGTQFGKLIYQIKKENVSLKNLTIEKLEKLYVKFHKQAEEDPEMEQDARNWFKKLEKNDKEAKKIWLVCVDISLKEFNKIYNLLDIKIDYCLGESFYQNKLKKIIDEAIRKKIAVKSQGAIIIRYLREKLPPSMLLKSDGATTYLTRDLATIQYRLKKWKPNLIIYEIGADQILHLKQLFAAVERLGWAKKDKFFHISHGFVRWKHGKFSTRKGETIHLEEVLEEAVSRARKIIEKTKTNRGLSKKEKETIAQMVGIGAVKYNDLSQHHATDIIFDWDKVLNLKGNSGPYLQYTYARCQSVLKKSNLPRPVLGKLPRPVLGKLNLEKEEKNILRVIYKFPEIIQESADKFSPNLICNFAFDLAQKYNLFYNLHPIIKAKTPQKKEFRIALTFATGQILKNCLNLLGISAPNKM